ncbi:MAG: hypothetical protein V3U36_05195, partial [Anaerolineales bacterium]
MPTKVLASHRIFSTFSFVYCDTIAATNLLNSRIAVQVNVGHIMKVAVIGGGSTYTPELVNGFLDRVNEYPLNELWLMDIDEHRLSIVGGFYPANGAG